MTMYGFNPQAAPDPSVVSTDVDRWMLSHLAAAIDETTAAMDQYDFMQGYQTATRFFWSIFCDRYIEMIKDRFLNPGNHTDDERASALAALGVGFRAILGMFAPFAPFITDYLYQQMYQLHENSVSLHITSWPAAQQPWRTDRKLIDDMAVILDQIRVLRSGLNLGSNTRIAKIVLQGFTDDGRRTARALAEPLRVAARADEAVFADADSDSGVDGIRVAVIA